jgi:hypothetical protein
MSTVAPDTLRGRFERCSLAGSEFRHREHVRLTWIYLAEYGEEEALRRLADGLGRLAATNGAADRFHYTITRAWVRLVEAARQVRPTADSFDALIAACPDLLDRRTLGRFYSDACLQSAVARAKWVPPDLAPLP